MTDTIFSNEAAAEDHGDLFIRAVNLYGEITGVPVPQSENDGRFGTFSFNTYDIRQSYDALRDAIDLDPSTLTANLMLSYYLRDWMGKQKLDMLRLMENPDAFMTKIMKPKELLAIVDREDVAAARDGFITRVREALSRYGGEEREDVAKVLASTDQMAFLRRDALKGAARLDMHQFLDGEPEPADVRPVYHRQVYQWWNINSLLAAAVHMPSGVSLNLIRDKDEFQSYFCWCIRNGGRLLILTDAPVFTHPLQASMSRRPDRALGARSVQAWFPYDLLGLKWDEEAERFYVEKSDEKGLAVYQQEHKVLKPLAEIGAEEFIWSTMMLDLIVDRFWAKGETAPQLSYTGEMLKIENVLLDKAASSLTVTGAYEPLSLPPLTLHDVATGNLKPEHIGKMGSGRHDWMEKRYGSKVNPEVLNTVAQQGAVLLMPGDSTKVRFTDKEAKTEIIEGGLQRISASEVAATGHFGEKDLRSQSLVFFDSTKFGSREQIEADRVWLARHNYSRQIGRMASREFEERKDEVKAWVEKRLTANRDNLIGYAGNRELWIEAGRSGGFDLVAGGRSFSAGAADENGRKRSFRQFMSFHDMGEEKRTKDYDYSVFGAFHLSDGFDYHKGHQCLITGAVASYRIRFVPANAAQLAFLCGVEVSDLPDVLQHWTQGKSYVGNSILDRIDPMEWSIKDPWTTLSFRTMIYLSKRGWAKAEKQKTLPDLPGLVPPEDLAEGVSAYIDRLNASEKKTVDSTEEED